MAIVLGDLHGDISRARKFLAYKPEIEHVFVGDYVDDFVAPIEDMRACLQEIITSDAVALLGNHELSYLMPCPSKSSGYTGDYKIEQLIRNNKQRFKAAHAVDGFIITHAGVSIRHQPYGGCHTVIELADYLNGQMQNFFDTYTNNNLFDVGDCRGGWQQVGGIFWYDYLREQKKVGLAPFPQIFGHTESRRIEIKCNKEGIIEYVCVDDRPRIDTYNCFNTETKTVEEYFECNK